MFELKVTGEFSAAHNLREYLGKCEGLHGHNWKVEVLVCGMKLDKKGILLDFKQIKSCLNKLLDELDHKYLNSLSYFKRINPSSENIAKFIYNNLSKQVLGLKSVTVWESDSCSATYYGR